MEMMTTATKMKKQCASTSISRLVDPEESQMQTVVSQRGYSTPLLNIVKESQQVTWSGHETGPESDGHQVNCVIPVVKTIWYLST